MWIYTLLIATILGRHAFGISESDGDESRKILGSSVVTSVSVVMDTGNGSKAVYTDSVGKPQAKPSNPSEVASPINLLNPDRYEFYTFDDNGDLVKRLMSLEEIQSIIATGDSDGFSLDSFTSQGFMPEKRVNDIVNNVQNVLKEEIELHRDPPDIKPLFDTPDVSDSWSMILPAIFGNSGEDIKPEKPITHVTADTMLLEPMLFTSTQKLHEILTSSSTIKQKLASSTTARPLTTPKYTRSTTFKAPEKPTQSSTTEMISKWTQMSEKIAPMINVEIYSNSKSTTEKPMKDGEHIVEIKPNITKDRDNLAPQTSTTIFIKNPVTTVPTVASSREESPMPITFKPMSLVDLSSSNKTQTSDEFLLSSSLTPLATTNPPAATTNPPVSVTTTPLKHLPTFVPSSIGSTMPTTSATIEATAKLSTQALNISSQSTVRPFKMPTSPVFTNLPVTVDAIKPLPTLLSLPINPLLSTTEKITKLTSKPTGSSTKPVLLFSSSTKPTLKPPLTTQISDSTWRPKPTSNTVLQSPFTMKTNIFTWKPESFATTENKYESFTKSTLKPVALAQSNDLNINSSKDSIVDTTIIPLADKLTTFIEVVNEQNNLETSTVINYPTTQNEGIQISSKHEDLSIREYVGYNNKLPTTSDETESTTQLTLEHSLDSQQKVSASELLDQLLITTNIYEINTELSDKAKTTHSKTTDENYATTEEILTETATNKEIRTTETTELPTTEIILSSENSTENAKTQPLLESIVHILSQAIGNVKDSLNVTNTIKVQQMLNQNINKTTAGILKDTATVASSLMDLPTDLTEKEISTTEEIITDLVGPDDILRDSVGSLLSQVYESDLIAVDNIITTEVNPTTTGIAKATSIPNRKSDEDISNVTSVELLFESTTLGEGFYDPVDFEETTTVLSKNNLTSPENSFHLINITIISSENRTKPAKADLSLEQMYFENLTTLGSLQAMPIKSDLLKANHFSNIEAITDTTITLPTTELYTSADITEKNTDAFSETEKPTTIVKEEISTAGFTNEPTATNWLESTTLPQNLLTYSISSITSSIMPSIVITMSDNSTKISENGNLIHEQSNAKAPEKQPASISSINIMPLRKQENILDEKWTLVSTVAPHKLDVLPNISPPTPSFPTEIVEPPVPIDLVPKPMQGFGLEDSTSQLDVDIYQFVQLCNELAFNFWKTVTGGLSSARSIIVSPFAATSLLAMVFLGAKGATSGEMNEILKLDDMVTFNPHLIFKNVSESIRAEPNSGIAITAMTRELFSDRSKGKLLDFYKNRARAFYDGYVEEVSYREIGDVIRRRTNLLVKKYTDGKITEYLKDSSLIGRSPLTGISTNIFQTDCSEASIEGRDGELHFVVLPSIRQRRLVPIPAVVLKSGFLAGYEPSLDATAVSLGTKDQVVSTILVIPGQQGIASPGDGLTRLEKRLIESSFKKGAWSRLLRSLIPRTGMEVQIPRFSHKSIINATNTLKRMGLHELFDPEKADLRGLNGVANELHLSDVLQINNFATCGEGRIGESHQSEIYPATALRARSARFLNQHKNLVDVMDEPRDYQRAFHDPLHDPTYLSLPLPLRPRQARVPEIPRLKFDRPFMYFVRHNPTGLILHMGRFNPRLLP